MLAAIKEGSNVTVAVLSSYVALLAGSGLSEENVLVKVQ